MVLYLLVVTTSQPSVIKHGGVMPRMLFAERYKESTKPINARMIIKIIILFWTVPSSIGVIEEESIFILLYNFRSYFFSNQIDEFLIRVRVRYLFAIYKHGRS